MIWLLDQDGLDWFGPKMTVQLGSRPDPKGYSKSLFKPPGFWEFEYSV